MDLECFERRGDGEGRECVNEKGRMRKEEVIESGESGKRSDLVLREQRQKGCKQGDERKEASVI